MRLKRKLRKPKLPNFREWVNFVLAMGRATLFLAIAVAILCGLMFWKLSTLTPGLSQAELVTLESANQFSDIADNMVNAPYRLAVFASTSVFESILGLRLVGAILGATAVIIFYLLARRLYNSYISLAATTMFATCSLLLATARQATPNVMLLSLLAIVGAGFFLRFSKRQDIGWILAAIVIGLSLYVPGMIFFIAVAVLWQFHHVRKSFERLETPIIAITSVVFGLLIAPLIINLIREPELWRAYLGLPAQFAPFMDMIKYAGTAVLSLFAISPNEPSYWLGRQPILDVFASVMFIYGTLSLLGQYRLDRLWTLGGIFLLAFLWIGATTNRLAIVMLLPFVYIVIGIGIQRFMNRWLRVFPKNPIARWAGGLLLFAVIVLSINFQAHRYFVAWPNSPATKAVFNQPYPTN